MTDDDALRARVLEAIRMGKLPDRSPESIWGGKGSDADCALCGVHVRPHEAALELEFAPSHEESSQGNYHVHPRCFSTWDSERHAARSPRGRSTAAALPPVVGDSSIPDHEHEAALHRGSS